MRKLIRRLFLAVVVVFFYSACKKPQTYSIIPSIAFTSLVPQQSYNGLDSNTIITISFTDGDGDIGCTPSPCTDFIVSFFEKENGVWVEDIVCDSCVGFSGALPYLTPDGNNKAVKGQISMVQYIQLTQLYNPQSDTIHYQVYIIDRAGHKSNTITTSDLVVSVVL